MQAGPEPNLITISIYHLHKDAAGLEDIGHLGNLFCGMKRRVAVLINAKEKELKGSVKIGEEDCYEVRVVYDSVRPQEATWCFSKKDFLPRCVHRRFPAPSAERVGQRWTLTEVEVDPVYLKDPFKLRAPDGFTKAVRPVP